MKFHNFFVQMSLILGILIFTEMSMGMEHHYEPPPYHEPHKPHHDPYKPPHHEPHKPHHEPHKPHHDPYKPHHEPHKPHYEPPPPPQYEPPTSHHEPHKPHHEPYKPDHEPHKPHHEPHKPHYEPHKPHHEPHKPHHEPYKPTDPYHKPPHHKKDDPDCVDISTWSEVKYKKVEKEHCKLDYEKYTEKKQDKVCDEVTSIHCSVLPYTECEMKMKDVKHTSCEWFWNYQSVKKCHNVTKTITHYKKKPKCTKVPKYHCEEKWEVDDHGKKVWAGNGDCKLIEWEDCKLVSVPAKFDYMQPDCSHKINIPVHDIRDKPDHTQVSSMTCKVKKTTKCIPKVAKKCRNIYYTETVIKPVSRCEPFYIYVPFQERHHKQKCLFGDHAGGLPTDPLKGLHPGQSPHGPVKPTSPHEY